nr:type II toxin-antitoxin system HipA family toxin YjjJ [uncultured Desulfobacter sp.]
MPSIIEYLRRGPSTSKEIQFATNLSQPTVSRQIKDAGDTIVQIRDGRTIRYAATCNAFGAGDRIPLGTIDSAEKCAKVADVRPLTCGGFFIEPKTDDFPPVLFGDAGTGLFEDLPYFLYDMRPQGFIGRQIAKKIAEQLEDFPANPKAWNTDYIGRFLISKGEDLPGNFVFGEPNFMRIGQKSVPVSETDYPDLAASVLKGEPPGSSAGGEQAKFTAFNKNLNAHVIVKFSPKGENEVAVRYRDVLYTEYHASQVLTEHGYAAVVPNIYDLGGRLFLEFERFDRVGEFGRISMLSLDVLDREFVGYGNNWQKVVTALFQQGLTDEQTVQHVEVIQQFGILIQNNDMHLGNLSFSIQQDKLSLLPVYDMCSMGFAPKNGEVLPFEIKASPEDVFEEVSEMVQAFWARILGDERISESLQNFVDQNTEQINAKKI